METAKVQWAGFLLSIQPRIRLTRSYDERHHIYLGYALLVEGTIGIEERIFWIGIGKTAQEKFQFQVGDKLSGVSHVVQNPKLEIVEFYKTSKLNLMERDEQSRSEGPPWHGITPNLYTYRERGHRRLAVRTYESKCQTCMWGCKMPVEMIVDHWNPRNKRYRVETFCYGPKSCKFYSAGPTRKVPGRKGMSWEEPDWLDEEETGHRGVDE